MIECNSITTAAKFNLRLEVACDSDKGVNVWLFKVLVLADVGYWVPFLCGEKAQNLRSPCLT